MLSSERQLRRQLNPARRAAAEEWVAQSHIAGGVDCVASGADLLIPIEGKAVGRRLLDAPQIIRAQLDVRRAKILGEPRGAVLRVWSLRNSLGRRQFRR